MFKAFLEWLFGSRRPAPAAARPAMPERRGFEALNRDAPLREDASATQHAAAQTDTFLCREAVLGRDQRIAGYQFMLQEATHSRIRHSSRRVNHLYAEVLVSNLVRADIAQLLGHRLAFIEIPDSFLAHPSVDALPARNIVLLPTLHADDGAPSPTELRESVERLRAAGFMLAIPDPAVAVEFSPLLPLADVVILHAPALDARRGLQLSGLIAEAAPNARLLIRDLPSLEEFRFCYKLGASLFQGPFITSREDWSERDLAPSTVRITSLIGRLRGDADTRELAALLKQDAALSLRLLRYINAAANALPERVSSIERALVMLGRDKLYRWLILLACSTESGERSSAALENALVRARLMETLLAASPPAEREALFLTGLLSLVDVVMQVPMERAIGPLALDGEIVGAIRFGEGRYAPLLELAIACEQPEAGRVQLAAERCGVSPQQASERHMEALAWAMEIQQ